jgi:hypothetical protein
VEESMNMKKLTPFQVHENIDELYNSPITSTRRALTVLTKKGYLCKTDKMVVGEYGIKCHCWRIVHE